MWRQAYTLAFMMPETTLMPLSIQFVVSQVSKFMHSPGTKHWHVAKHWQAIKRLFHYLSGTRAGTLGCFILRGDHCRQIYMLFQILIGLVAMTLVWFLLHAWQLMHISKKQPIMATSPVGQLSQYG